MKCRLLNFSDNHYATETGEIFKIGRALVCKNGVTRLYKSKELCQDITKHGYHRVNFYINGIKFKKLVHRLVLETFRPIENMDTLECDHIDGDTHNNELINLQWLTKHENLAKKKF